MGRDVCRFRHELQREVAYELAPPSVRQALHGRVADALVAISSQSAPDWRLVALHYDKAERFDDAAHAYQQAASDARRRGAPDESRAFLTNAIEQLERTPRTAERDQRDIELRLRRGFLASAVEGTASEQAAVDFERCLELVGTEPTEQFFITMAPLYGYYATRGDLRRAEKVLLSVRPGITAELEWFRPNNDAGLAMVAWYRGQFAAAREQLESAATRSDIAAVEHEAHWFTPNEPVASIYVHLAAARLTEGDFAGAESAFERSARRVERLGFPQGPYTHAYARSYEAWMYMEAGQLERAAEVIAALAEQAERHGFDAWVLIGATQQSTVAALSAIAADSSDPEALEEHIGMMSMFVEAWREAEVKMFLTFYDSVLARVLIAAGRFEEARERLESALELATDTEVHFYDAELLRLRAHTETNQQAKRETLVAALDLARRQGALIFELRSARDLFDVDGEAGAIEDVVDRFPAGSTWPELTRARALLG
jgi:tetratricopeptide (TPR) repeat protein